MAAIDEARIGLEEGGIPIGSVIVHNGKIIGRGHNRRIQKGSPTLHGEMDALGKCRPPTSQCLQRICNLYHLVPMFDVHRCDLIIWDS